MNKYKNKSRYKNNFPEALAALKKNKPDYTQKTETCLAEIPDEDLKAPACIKVFGKRIQAKREQKQYTLDQEEARIGIAHSTIKDLESNQNRKKIDRDYLLAFSLLFQCSPKYFLYENASEGLYGKLVEPMEFAEDHLVSKSRYIIKSMLETHGEEQAVNLELLNFCVLLSLASTQTQTDVYESLIRTPRFAKSLRKTPDLAPYEMSGEDWFEFICSRAYRQASIPALQKLNTLSISGASAPADDNPPSLLTGVLQDLGEKNPNLFDLIFQISISDFETRKTVCDWLKIGEFFADSRRLAKMTEGKSD